MSAENNDNVSVIPPEVNERLKEAELFAAALQHKLETETPEMLSTAEANFVPPERPAKKVTKGTLIEDCWKLQTALKLDNPRPRSYFERLSKSELEEYVVFLTNKGANKLQGTDAALKKDVSVGEHKMSAAEVKYGAKALFQFNLILCKVAELGSTNFKEQLGTDLLGLGDDVIENREQLEEILAQIYQEHAELLGSYISPLNQYFLLMTAIGAGRATKNVDRVKKELEKKQAD